MPIIVEGNKTKEVPQDFILQKASEYKHTIMDLGAGDGRFIYKNAKKTPDKFFIGIEPAQNQLQKYSKKSIKENLENASFVVGSIEVFPFTRKHFVDELYILLPWGSLLKEVVSAQKHTLDLFKQILKPLGELFIVFGYSQEAEPSETERLGLLELNNEKVHKEVLPKYLDAGFNLVELREINKEDLFEYETTWSKKLTFGQDRPIFLLHLKL